MISNKWESDAAMSYASTVFISLSPIRCLLAAAVEVMT